MFISDPSERATATSGDFGEVTLASILSILRRRRAQILWPLGVFVLLAGISCVVATPRYRATVQILVQQEDGGAFGLESTVSGAAPDAQAGDAMDYGLTLQTVASMLRSPSIAADVIATTGLERTREYFGAPPPGWWGSRWKQLKSTMPWHKTLEPLTVPLDQAPNRRYVAEKIFAGRLTVKPVAGTRLIDISYLDRDPVRAARAADATAEALRDAVFRERFSETVQGSRWLEARLDELRRNTEQARARAAELERGTGVFGADASRNVVLERLDSLNQTLTEAESNRILKESIDHVAATGDAELISSLSGNSGSGQVASMNTSLSLIQGLRQQEAQVRGDLDAANMRYGPNYPRVGELKAELAGLTKAIASESQRLGERAHSDYEVAVAQEQGARAAFEQQKQLATHQNDTVIQYELARQEADSSRALYEGLLTKLQQARLLEGMRANNVSVTAPAQVPPTLHPASPNIPVRLAIGAAAGLLLGLLLAAWTELTDSSIQSPAQVEGLLGVPLLVVLPALPRSRGLHGQQLLRRLPGGASLAARTSAEPRTQPGLPLLQQQTSPFSEGLRSLRTSLLLARGGAPPQIILITSSIAGEGKSTIAANLAVLFAQNGARTLLVDADLRRPALHHAIRDAAPCGLATALTGPEPATTRQLLPQLPQLRMLCGSEVAPFPAELLGSLRMTELVAEWRGAYDAVILDSPPVLPVTDASLLARHADAVLLVARHNHTPRQALQRGVQVLQSARREAAPIGVVMNDVGVESAGFVEYFGYGGHPYVPERA